MTLISFFIIIAAFAFIFWIYKKVYLYFLYIKVNKFSKWEAYLICTAVLWMFISLTLNEFYLIYKLGEKPTITFTIIATVIVWFFVHFSERKIATGYFNRNESGFKKVEPKDRNKIDIYPRISIITNVKGRSDWDTIFDSSDFYVINDTLGVFSGAQPSFQPGRIIKIKNKKYVVEKNQIDFIKIYDDYSLMGHTPEYKGDDTPYNIQIFVEVKKQQDS